MRLLRSATLLAVLFAAGTIISIVSGVLHHDREWYFVAFMCATSTGAWIDTAIKDAQRERAFKEFQRRWPSQNKN